MTSKTPQAYVLRARNNLLNARGNLIAALELLNTLHYPPTNITGVQEALQDNENSIQYLSDIAHILELTAPPLKP